MIRTPYNFQPIWAKVVIERIGQDSDLRTPARVNELLDAYARTYGETVTDSKRADVHELIMRRYQGMVGMRDWPNHQANEVQS